MHIFVYLITFMFLASPSFGEPVLFLQKERQVVEVFKKMELSLPGNLAWSISKGGFELGAMGKNLGFLGDIKLNNRDNCLPQSPRKNDTLSEYRKISLVRGEQRLSFIENSVFDQDFRYLLRSFGVLYSYASGPYSLRTYVDLYIPNCYFEDSLD